MCDFSRIRITAIEKDYTEYIYDDKCYKIALNGLYQVYNSVVAIEVARCLNRYSGCSITDEQIKKGLAAARWKGRFEQVGSDPDIYIDGAHNVGGWQSLAQNVREYFKDKRLIYVCGVFKDKEYEKMIKTGKGSYGGYTYTFESGDGDFLTADTLLDFKVSKSKPTNKHNLQLLMY